MGPVTKEEYESRATRYDEQIKTILNLDPSGKSTEEKIQLLRTYREKQYESLQDAVYKRRGWDQNGVPTLETVKELGIDFPEILDTLNHK